MSHEGRSQGVHDALAMLWNITQKLIYLQSVMTAAVAVAAAV
jgi:hypothetical protein